MNRQHRLIQSLTGHDDAAVLQFFVTFSRFEYALKQAGFVRGDQSYATPDWDRFARERGNALFAEAENIELTEAITLLLREPPQRQIVRNNKVTWEQNAKRNGEGNAQYLLRLVKDVRNNLFHGGKYPSRNVSGQELRNSRLLRACSTILEACLALDEDVKHYFEFLHGE